MELNLFFLAPLLQYTSIDRCALFMRAKKKILFYSAPEIKYIISFSLSLCASLSLSQSLSSYPLPRLSQALILSQLLSSLTVTLSISLIHRRWPNPAVPSPQSPHRHSPFSPSLSQAPSFTAASPTQPS